MDTYVSGLDGRSAERRFEKQKRAAFLAHIGGDPSPTQDALLDQAVSLALRLHVMDLRFKASGCVSDHDTRTYLAWANTYRRTLVALGLEKKKSATPLSLAQHRTARAATP